MGTRAGFMANISTGHHNSRASAGITLYTSATYVRVPTAMEFHPVRYDINLWRINAVPGPPLPFPLTRCWPLLIRSPATFVLEKKRGLIRGCHPRLLFGHILRFSLLTFDSKGKEEDWVRWRWRLRWLFHDLFILYRGISMIFFISIKFERFLKFFSLGDYIRSFAEDFNLTPYEYTIIMNHQICTLLVRSYEL